jgi:hypothetical protein
MTKKADRTKVTLSFEVDGWEADLFRRTAEANGFGSLEDFLYRAVEQYQEHACCQPDDPAPREAAQIAIDLAAPADSPVKGAE